MDSPEFADARVVRVFTSGDDPKRHALVRALLDLPRRRHAHTVYPYTSKLVIISG